jgi:hypothetical protein
MDLAKNLAVLCLRLFDERPLFPQTNMRLNEMYPFQPEYRRLNDFIHKVGSYTRHHIRDRCRMFRWVSRVSYSRQTNEGPRLT